MKSGNCSFFVKGMSVSKDLRCIALGINVAFHIVGRAK